MSNRPLVSILMSMRDAQRTLATTLRSIILQSHNEWELILIDDGSTDASVAVARSFADPRIHIHPHRASKGLATRLNEAMTLARGDYLARMDADDVCYPQRLARQVAYLDAHPEVDLVGSGAIVFDDSGHAVGRFPVRETHDRICAQPYAGFYLAHPTWVGRASWFRSHRYDPRRTKAQDQDLLLRAYRTSRYAALSEPLLGYRQDHLSVSKSLQGRWHFSCAIAADALAQSRPLVGGAAIAAQAVKALVDTLTISTGLARLVLRHRALPLAPDDAERWRALWTQCNPPGATTCAA